MSEGMDWKQLAQLTPIGVVLGAALVVVFLDLALSHKDRYMLPWIAMTGAVLGLASTFQTATIPGFSAPWFTDYSAWMSGETPRSVILGGAFCIDRFGLAIWMIACMAGALSMLCTPPPNEDAALTTGEYYGLNLLAVAGMMLLAVSHDFMTLVVSLEIMSIATYILTASSRDHVASNEAGIKYLVLGAFSTAFLLMGIAFYYGAFGSLSLAPSRNFISLLINDPHEAGFRLCLVYLSLGFILVGTLFKAGAAPFHFWIPDVYEGAPTAVTSLMATGVKAAAVAVVARIVFETFGLNILRINLMPMLSVMAVLTMAIGNIFAMRQTSVKRMLAYSGVAHTGYLLLSFLLHEGDVSSATIDAHTRAAAYYLLVYGVMTIGAFGVISLIREDGRPLETFDDFTNLAKENPGIALCMSIFMFSLAGMPPAGGFFAKFLIFRGAVEQGYVVPAVLGILTSVASLYYYLRVIVKMYMPATDHHAKEEEHGMATRYSWGSSLLIYAAGIITVIVGLGMNTINGWLS
jgi:NADH-quinone oxidoreductase subunit N